MMRASLWLLLAAATVASLFWLFLVFASGFTIWTDDSNLEGLTIQAALIFSPIALWIGLKASANHLRQTVLLFVVAWTLALGMTLLLM